MLGAGGQHHSPAALVSVEIVLKPIADGVGEHQSRSGWFKEKRKFLVPTWVRAPDRPCHSELLY
jgi:hypothetical protein